MPKWELPPDSHERTLESPHYTKCTHRMDHCLLIKDAEQAAIFWCPRPNQIHVSVHLENPAGGGGFICKVLSTAQYERMDEADEMRLIQEQVRKLRPLL